MRLLHKDHKDPGSVKVRRLNGPGMNVGIGNCIADILEPIANEMPRKWKMECGSTESALNLADTYNKKLDKVKNTIMCKGLLMDLVDVLWPSEVREVAPGGGEVDTVTGGLDTVTGGLDEKEVQGV